MIVQSRVNLWLLQEEWDAIPLPATETDDGSLKWKTFENITYFLSEMKHCEVSLLTIKSEKVVETDFHD